MVDSEHSLIMYNIKIKNIIIVISAIIVIVLIIAITLMKTGSPLSKNSSNNADFVVSGVPYFGIYNHKGKTIGGATDTAATVASVLEYWYPGENNLKEIGKTIITKNGDAFIGSDAINNYINYAYKDKLTIREEKLDLNGLKKYINSDTRTPLIAFLPVSNDQPSDVAYHPAAVVIGMKETEKKVVLHDYWQGNNYEISYADFEKRLGGSGNQGQFIVIQPVNLKGTLVKLAKISPAPYPARTDMMGKDEAMFQNYALCSRTFVAGQTGMALGYCEKTLNDTNFEASFPPYFKVALYVYLAGIYNIMGNDLNKAEGYARKAVELNHDLDKPFKDWLGYDINMSRADSAGKASWPNQVLGNVLRNKGQFQEAIDNYNMALNIYPANRGAKEGLALATDVLAKQTKSK